MSSPWVVIQPRVASCPRFDIPVTYLYTTHANVCWTISARLSCAQVENMFCHTLRTSMATNVSNTAHIWASIFFNYYPCFPWSGNQIGNVKSYNPVTISSASCAASFQLCLLHYSTMTIVPFWYPIAPPPHPTCARIWRSRESHSGVRSWRSLVVSVRTAHMYVYQGMALTLPVRCVSNLPNLSYSRSSEPGVSST